MKDLVLVAVLTAGAIDVVVNATEHGATLFQESRSLTGVSCLEPTCTNVYDACVAATRDLYCTGNPDGPENNEDTEDTEDCHTRWNTWCETLRDNCQSYDSKDCPADTEGKDCCKEYCQYNYKACVDSTKDDNYDHCWEILCDCITSCNKCWYPPTVCLDCHCRDCSSCSCPDCPYPSPPCKHCPESNCDR